MYEKDCFGDFIAGFGFGVGRSAPGGITTTIALATLTATVQDDRAIKFSTIFISLINIKRSQIIF